MMRIFALIIATAFIWVGCAKNQVTGRSQLKLLPERELQGMALQQYRQFLTQHKVVAAAVNKDAEMVRRVGTRIAYAINKFYEEQGQARILEGFQWEFNLVEDPLVNAWCMPGGKVVVYTGLLPVAKNEAGLAVVMGHEIAHAVALHGNERMSQGMMQQLGGVALSVALADRPAETQNMFLAAYGLGSQVGVLLPFSRRQELEADRFGLRFSAMAGYNPEEAVPFWERMAAAAAGGQKPPEFLSTHPSDATRISRMKQFIAEAMQFYRPISK